MELTVVYSNSRLGFGLLSRLALAVHGDLVVDAKLALRHTGEVGLHQDLPGYVSRQDLSEKKLKLKYFLGTETDLALGRHQQVDVLDHVQEQLVPPVLDALPPPANLAGHLAGDGGLLLLGGRLHPLLGDEGLQDARVGVLGVTEVHDLIQDLVDEYKVILDILLADLPEVILHDIDHLQEELEDHGGVDILLGDGSEPEVGSLDVKVRCSRNVRHRRPHLAPGVDNVDSECVHSIAADIVPVDSGDENLALVVVAKQPTDHGDGG